MVALVVVVMVVLCATAGRELRGTRCGFFRDENASDGRGKGTG